MTRRRLLGAAGVLAGVAVGLLAWWVAAPRVGNEVVVRNASGQHLDLVRVRFGGRDVEVRDVPAGATASVPAPPAADGDVRADVWYADGRSAETTLGGPGTRRFFGWQWAFVVGPPGGPGGGLTGSYAPR